MATNSKVFEIVSDCVATIVTSRHDRSLLNPSREIVHIHPEAGTLVRGFYFAAHDPESSPPVARVRPTISKNTLQCSVVDVEVVVRRCSLDVVD